MSKALATRRVRDGFYPDSNVLYADTLASWGAVIHYRRREAPLLEAQESLEMSPFFAGNCYVKLGAVQIVLPATSLPVLLYY
jgi:hypothetical protein